MIVLMASTGRLVLKVAVALMVLFIVVWLARTVQQEREAGAEGGPLPRTRTGRLFAVVLWVLGSAAAVGTLLGIGEILGVLPF